MSDTPFKTPRSKYHHRIPKRLETPTTSSNESLSSVSSNGDNNNGNHLTTNNNSNGDVSLIVEFDDIRRDLRYLKDDKIHLESVICDFLVQTKLIVQQKQQLDDDLKRLKDLYEIKMQECCDLENKLKIARKLIDKERNTTRTKLETLRIQRDDLIMQLSQVRDVITREFTGNRSLPDDTRNKLSFLDDYQQQQQQQNRNLSAIKEVNSTGSILSDFSYSRSEDDLDESLLRTGKSWRKHRPSSSDDQTTQATKEPALKKRRSATNKIVEINKNESIRATTTVTVNDNGGPITATSIIETIPSQQQQLLKQQLKTTPTAPPADLVFESWARNNSPVVINNNNNNNNNDNNNNINKRSHNFQSKLVVLRDTCTVCEKRIGFRKQSWKCIDCKATCHYECKEKLPLPCIPAISTPNRPHNLGLISDFTPTTPPMVPAILIHCINEVELRGLQEIGIYRIPGSERDVKQLKEKFLRNRTVPQLNQVDIHVICGCIKDFLRSLNEPLLTYRLRKDFVKIINQLSLNDLQLGLYRLINELPQPNRDTLAYIIVHLQKVAQAKECKMNTNNLAMVFGPTIVGYASDDLDSVALINQVAEQKRIMEYLLEIPSDYWLNFINVNQENNNNNGQQFMKLQQTPSTDSLLRPAVTTTPMTATPSSSYYTPNRKLLKKRQKYFPSPK